MTVISTLPICCICGQVSDEQAGASVEVEWTQLQTYLDRYHMDQASIRLSHTYCPSCYKKQAQVWRVLPTTPLST